MNNKIWITWENHRRTSELSNEIGSDLIAIKSFIGLKYISHFHKFLITIKVILCRRPKLLIVQNPSIVLAFLGAFLKPFFKYRYIIDRHTNFRIGKKIGLNPVNVLKVFLSNFSIKYSDLTIVTNEFLSDFVELKGGRGFVLPDKLPRIKRYSQQLLDGIENIVFICTYAKDEPYAAVIRAAKELPSTTVIYITGNFLGKINQNDIPINVRLTGYLCQEEYDRLLASADIIMDFTTLDWCLVCGGYEAVALDKPLITSDSQALNQFYGGAALYTNHDPVDIAKKISIAIEKKQQMQKNIIAFRHMYQKDWNNRFLRLQQMIIEN